MGLDENNNYSSHKWLIIEYVEESSLTNNNLKLATPEYQRSKFNIQNTNNNNIKTEQNFSYYIFKKQNSIFIRTTIDESIINYILFGPVSKLTECYNFITNWCANNNKNLTQIDQYNFNIKAIEEN